MKLLLYLFLLLVIIIKRHAAADWLLDAAGHPEHWQVVALATWSVVSIGVVCALVCAAVLVLNELLPDKVQP